MTRVELGPPAGRDRWEIEHDGRRYLVLRHDGDWLVVDALCPHRQGRLIDGLTRGDALVCPSHWYTFALPSGTCRTSPDYQLGVYDVTERDGRLVAHIPDQPRRTWADILRAHAQGG